MLKKTFLTIAVIGMLSILNSCELRTYHPIFTSKDLVFEPALLGTWRSEKGATLHYRKANKAELDQLTPSIREEIEKIYMLTSVSDDESVVQYFAFLVKLGNNLYFDYYPVDIDKSGKLNDFYKSHYIRMHSISRVSFVNNSSIRISQFEDEFMNKMIREKNIRIRHEVVDDDNYFITASTDELQKYILKYGDSPEAYGSSGGTTYSRITNL